MKVLYLSHNRENSGWSQAAINQALALDSVGIDVVSRTIKLNDKEPVLPERILELEAKGSKGCDVVIQHVLPQYMDYNHKLRNIGLFVAETDSILFTGWPQKLNQMDEVWVPNHDMVGMCRRSGVEVDIHVVPHAINMDKFQAEVEPLDIPPIQDTYNFYFIGEFIRRKRLSALVEAFHAEFDRNELVSLVIKSHHPGSDADQSKKMIMELCNQVKRNLRLYANDYDYHSEIIISRFLTEAQLASLHKQCHCMVQPSYGESWSIPSSDSLGFGNDVIAGNVGGFKEYVNPDLLIDGHMTPVFGADAVLHNLHTGREQWFSINIADLMKKMRFCLENYRKNGILKVENRARIEAFSYENVGQLMMEILS